MSQRMKIMTTVTLPLDLICYGKEVDHKAKWKLRHLRRTRQWLCTGAPRGWARDSCTPPCPADAPCSDSLCLERREVGLWVPLRSAEAFALLGLKCVCETSRSRWSWYVRPEQPTRRECSRVWCLNEGCCVNVTLMNNQVKPWCVFFISNWLFNIVSFAIQ